ncbi:MAG TPA: NAD(P)H-binding protein [Anaerolineales bacterium]|nr:NAD(P)H-binding protein [Anaerolineales bacterium]
MSYLITGATGVVGRHIVDKLVVLGAEVHALSRKPDQANLPRSVQVFGGDLASSDLEAAIFKGVKAIFLFAAFGDLKPFLGKAKAAGVERIVVLSSLAAAAEFPRDLDSPSYHHHRAIEQAVESSGIPYTFLRPGSFANNLLFWSYSIKTTRTVSGPYPQSAQVLIHELDVADVAVTVLTTDGHEGASYALTGPESLTQAEQLKTIGAAIGQQLTFQTITPEQFTQSMRQFMPADIIKMMLDYWSDTVEQPEAVRPTVEQITGRPGLSLARWAADHASDFI